MNDLGSEGDNGPLSQHTNRTCSAAEDRASDVHSEGTGAAHPIPDNSVRRLNAILTRLADVLEARAK